VAELPYRRFMTPRIADALKLLRDLIPEIAKFGVVGATGAIVDLGGSGVLYGVYHLGPLKAKAIAFVAATIITYVGNRFWTFRHRVNHHWLREISYFLLLNAAGLAIAEGVIAFTTYGLDARGNFAYNMANIAGTALGTIFRYFTYKKWVWIAPLPPSESDPQSVTERNIG
jgi:putative flippase GtrA